MESINFPGMRFLPTDQELLQFYVFNKNFNPHVLPYNYIQDVDIYEFHPDELTSKCLIYTNNIDQTHL